LTPFFVNKKYNGVGHVWQGRFKSSLVEKENYALQCGYYIEDNPRRAKLVEKIENWPWSSYHFYAFGKFDPLVDVEPFYLELGESAKDRQRNYQKFFKVIEEEHVLKDIREKLHQGILGSTDFIKKIKEKFKIKLIGKKGRPRKGA